MVQNKRVHYKNKHFHIACDISANKFDNQFADNDKNELQNNKTFYDDLFWKCPKNIDSICFTRLYD